MVELANGPLPIVLRRHPRATRLTMRLSPQGDALRITVPPWGRTADALAFAKGRTEWIEGQLAKLAPVSMQPIADGGACLFRGEDLRIVWSEGARRKPMISGDALTLGGPAECIPARVQNWLEGEALALLESDLAHYCARAGQAVPALRLSRAQRRWGSCASSRSNIPTIRINWRLVMAPDNVRRSVVAHEVAHLTHFDHSPAFHAHLAALFDGDLPAADGWLKREGRTLYGPFG